MLIFISKLWMLKIFKCNKLLFQMLILPSDEFYLLVTLGLELSLKTVNIDIYLFPWINLIFQIIFKFIDTLEWLKNSYSKNNIILINKLYVLKCHLKFGHIFFILYMKYYLKFINWWFNLYIGWIIH